MRIAYVQFFHSPPYLLLRLRDCLERYFKTLMGDTVVENALKELEKLISREGQMTAVVTVSCIHDILDMMKNMIQGK